MKKLLSLFVACLVVVGASQLFATGETTTTTTATKTVTETPERKAAWEKCTKDGWTGQKLEECVTKELQAKAPAQGAEQKQATTKTQPTTGTQTQTQ